MSRIHSTADLSQARRAFFERGNAAAPDVPKTILQSWLRCRRLGMPAETSPSIEPIPDARLREMRQRNERLWRLARAELESLSSDANASGSIVVLTDDAGWVLDAAGHPQFLDKAGRVALMPGTCWNEAQVGTNAIGTAIVERRPVEVRGSEHYRATHGILTCNATPIHDPYGQLVGVLDITGDSRAQHLHALGLVRMAVANIEHRYFDDGIGDCELLRLHRDPALLGSAREGLLAFRAGKLVAANQAGLALLDLQRDDLGHATYDGLFEDALSLLRRDGVLRDRFGRALFGRIDESGASKRSVAPVASLRGQQTPAPARPHVRPIDAPLFDASTAAALDRACRVLDAELPVLIVGETGTGKEVFARELHRRCARHGQPFVAVNCAALPEGLIEAELFGYEEGAFTGARRQGNPGLLRQANGGVLFLDEIGDMPLALQPRLLRVLQERELSPLGGGKPVKLDFALICATHSDLEAAIAERRFRADLYYRVAHHTERLAPLRDVGDRASLVATLWTRMAQHRTLTDAAQRALAAYPWPGNWRQLVACLRTLVALHDDGAQIGLEALPGYLRRSKEEATISSPIAASIAPLEEMEETAMRDTLAACDGNVARAARLLGVNRSTLYRRLGKPERTH
ncbi:MAG: sigma-54-dependent Fis family transcriptional regulator [Lysobacteraceae bacterium]